MDSIMDFLFLVFTTVEAFFNQAGETIVALSDVVLPVTPFTVGLLVCLSASLRWLATNKGSSYAWYYWHVLRMPARLWREYWVPHKRALMCLCEDTVDTVKISSCKAALQLEMQAGTTLNWEHASMKLIVGKHKDKRRARKRFVGSEWIAFCNAVPAEERTAIYRAAISLVARGPKGDTDGDDICWDEGHEVAIEDYKSLLS